MEKKVAWRSVYDLPLSLTHTTLSVDWDLSFGSLGYGMIRTVMVWIWPCVFWVAVLLNLL